MRPRVLIVDDHEDFRASARALLELQGFEVVAVVEDGEATLDAVERLRPDLVLPDVQLPGMDGFEVAERLATSPQPLPVTARRRRHGDPDPVRVPALAALLPHSPPQAALATNTFGPSDPSARPKPRDQPAATLPTHISSGRSSSSVNSHRRRRRSWTTRIVFDRQGSRYQGAIERLRSPRGRRRAGSHLDLLPSS